MSTATSWRPTAICRSNSSCNVSARAETTPTTADRFADGRCDKIEFDGITTGEPLRIYHDRGHFQIVRR
jgi:hypothetical protein